MILRTAILLVFASLLTPAQPQDIPELRNVVKLFQAGRLKDAGQAAERVIAQYPTRPEPYLWAARAWGQMRRFDKMVQHLTNAHQIAPDNATALLNLATALYNQAKWSEALHYLRKLDALLARLGNQGAHTKEQWKAPWMRGICAVKLDHIPEGIRAYSRALGLCTEQSARNEVRNRLAGTLLNSGRTAAAVAHFERLVEDVPGNPQHYYHLGVARMKLGDLDGAEEALMEALRRNPKDYLIPLKLGTIHQRRKDLLKAMSFFQMATEANPKAYEPWYSLMQIRSRRNELDEADAAHAKYEELYALSKEAEETSRSFNRAIKNNVNDTDAYFEFAMFLISHGKMQEAEERLLQLLSINPYHDRAIINVAQLLAREQRFQEAVYEFDKVLERDPDHPIANLESARALLQMGQAAPAYARITRAFTRMDRAKNKDRYIQTLAIFVRLATALRRPQDTMPEFATAMKVFDSDADMLGKLIPSYARVAIASRRTAEFFQAAEPASMVLGPNHPQYKAVIRAIAFVAQETRDQARLEKYNGILQSLK